MAKTGEWGSSGKCVPRCGGDSDSLVRTEVKGPAFREGGEVRELIADLPENVWFAREVYSVRAGGSEGSGLAKPGPGPTARGRRPVGGEVLHYCLKISSPQFFGSSINSKTSSLTIPVCWLFQ